MKEFNVLHLSQSIWLAGDKSISFWITLALGVIIVGWIHSQWDGLNKLPSFTKIIIWIILIIGLYYVGSYVESRGLVNMVISKFRGY